MEKEAEGIFDEIRPPRLEDAGLEDCALPPEAIKEAFLKAATAIRSTASAFLLSDGEALGGCTSDPWPSLGELSDELVGTEPEAESPGVCASEKGASIPDEWFGDKVVVAEEEEGKVDKVVEPSHPKQKDARSCVDGLQGLEIGSEDEVGGNGEEDENEDGRPVLVEGYVVRGRN